MLKINVLELKWFPPSNFSDRRNNFFLRWITLCFYTYGIMTYWSTGLISMSVFFFFGKKVMAKKELYWEISSPKWEKFIQHTSVDTPLYPDQDSHPYQIITKSETVDDCDPCRRVYFSDTYEFAQGVKATGTLVVGLWTRPQSLGCHRLVYKK